MSPQTAGPGFFNVKWFACAEPFINCRFFVRPLDLDQGRLCQWDSPQGYRQQRVAGRRVRDAVRDGHEKRSRIGAFPKIPNIDEKTCCTRWAKSIQSIAAVFGCTTFTKPQCSRISLVGPGKTPYHVQHSRQLPPEKHGLEPQVLRQWMQQHLHAPLPSFFRVAASHSAIETRDWQRCRDRVAVHHAYVWWLRHGLTPKVYSVL